MGSQQQSAEPSEDDASLLALVLDINPATWLRQQQHAPGLSLPQWLDQIASFTNSFLLTHGGNMLVVIAAGCSSSAFLHPLPQPIQAANNSSSKRNGNSSSANGGGNGGVSSGNVVEGIMRRLVAMMEKETKLVAGEEYGIRKGRGEGDEERGGGAPMEVDGEEEEKKGKPGSASLAKKNLPTLLSAALSLALTYIVKVQKQPPPNPSCRILCIHGSPDAPQQYVAVMNAIFSAQKHHVPIDTLCFGESHSAFLQQAAHLTNGLYVKQSVDETLLQNLLLVFGPDLYSRTFLHLPRPSGVDFRASCFCHRRAIDMGFVCSVCLSIFCSPSKKCSTCGAVFSSAVTAAPGSAPASAKAAASARPALFVSAPPTPSAQPRST